MRAIFSVLAISVAYLPTAGAATIDFEDILPQYFGVETYQEDGFTVTSNVPDGTIIDVNNDVRGNLGVFGGGTNSQTLVWGENGTNSIITLSNDAGSLFNLNSLDASSLTNLTGTLNLVGTLSGGGSINQSLALTSSLTTYVISGLDNLSALQISFDGNASFAPFDLDNIEMSVVPVPAAIWLFASGLGLLGALRRKRLKSF
jgi:hypothetical protein